MPYKTLSLTAALVACLSLTACSAPQAPLEPVDPQPASPLTYENPAYHKVTPQVAKQMMDQGVVVIDVRSPEEYQAGHIKGAVNVPLDTIKEGTILQAQPDVTKPILVHCRSGVRAEQASQILVKSGYQQVYNMYGTLQWPYGFVK